MSLFSTNFPKPYKNNEEIQQNNDPKVITKKPHPCEKKCNEWEIIRVGADIKIKCQGCGNIIMLSRYKFEKSVKSIISKE